MAAEVDVRGAGWRSKKFGCPCFNDTQRKTSEALDSFNSSAAPHRKDLISSVTQSLESRGSPADVPVALPALAACCLTAPILEERVFEGIRQHQPLGGLILQHAFNEVKQLVVLLCL